ncbi:hypothetical protein AMAG_03804 [Allomyces macrogynus ATCC 38327]|uniref:Vps52/Sac2 family protein n=1 Tax=Allomyces macrogynus (strain ATCC 38327) TaxID=578462 RepID=A0A0L0SAT0_ALLM3|nr:hypothetical protein AMAG_03804 [Allomyces macrogynus ATCC 38327]|eukprot:KNE59537.1 hypothetical protein AMAG_03804 [Allomyces macrogynus ATCC 38327]
MTDSVFKKATMQTLNLTSMRTPDLNFFSSTRRTTAAAAGPVEGTGAAIPPPPPPPPVSAPSSPASFTSGLTGLLGSRSTSPAPPPPPPPPAPPVAKESGGYSAAARTQVLVELLGEDIDKLTDAGDATDQGEPDLDADVLSRVDEDLSQVQDNDDLKEVLDKGADLKDYSTKLQLQLSQVEEELVRDYVAKVPELIDLEKKIDACESFLAKMATLLGGFQRDLGHVSQEIAVLQQRSSALGVQHANRAALQGKLSAVLDGTVISPDLIHKVVEAEVNELYLPVIAELNAKMVFVKDNKDSHIRAFKDAGPELERLRNKAAEKIREFFLDKFKALRQANTNIQMIQANVLLRFKPLNVFLANWHPEVAQEVRQHYVNLVARYFQAQFERYLKGMAKVLHPVADRTDVIAAEEARDLGSSVMAFFKAPVSALTNTTTASAVTGATGTAGPNLYALGDRARVVQDMDAPAIMTHVADEHGLRYPLEAVVRSVLRMVVDSASTEYTFDADFFVNQRKKLGSPTVIAHAVFQQVMEPSLKAVGSAVLGWAAGSYDALGLALAVKAHDRHVQLLEARGVQIASLVTFMATMQGQCMDRYRIVMGYHAESLRRSKAVAKEVHPHYITRRYAELASSILVIDVPPLVAPLQTVRDECEAFLKRLGAQQGNKLDEFVFLINNYDLVANILEVRTAAAPLSPLTMDYVDAALAPALGYLITFVEETEAQVPLDGVPASAFEPVVHRFNSEWRTLLSDLAAETLRRFSNFRHGAVVVQAVLSQIVVYWQRFHVLLDKRFGKGPAPFKTQPIGPQNVMVEIKKYKAPGGVGAAGAAAWSRG